MAAALWDLFENQKAKGLAGGMRQTLFKLEKAGQADARWFNAMGELAMLEKNYSVAARFFHQALDEAKKPEYELNWGNALFYAGDFQGAKKVLESYFQSYPTDVHGLMNLANCNLQLGDLNQAKTLCSKGLTLKMAKAPLWNCLGQIAFLEMDAAEAWKYFDKAYLDSPEYIDALYNRGNMAYHLGKLNDALHDFATCLRKDENYEQALINMAVILLEKGELENGKGCIAKALKLNAASVDAHHLLGRLHLAAKEFRSARDAFRDTLKLDPEHAPTLLALARLHIQEAEPEEAGVELRKLVTKKSLSKEESLAMLTLLMELGETGPCILYISKLPEAEKTPELRKILIVGLWKTGKIKEAIEHLENLLKIQGETSGNLIMLGRMLAQSGAEALAEPRFIKALELDPASQGAAFELARMHLARGEEDKAVSLLENQLSHHPDDPDCLYNLACCHARNRNFDDSLHCLKKALENGFHDLDKISGDEDLNYIRQFKEYNQLAGQSGLM